MKTALVQKRHIHHYGDLVFVLSGVSITEGEDPETKANALMNELQRDSETPLVFHRTDNESHMRALVFCSYSTPNNEEIKALVFPKFEEHHKPMI